MHYCANDTDVCDALIDKLQMFLGLIARCEVKRLPARQELTRRQNFCYARLLRAAMKGDFLAPDIQAEDGGPKIAPLFRRLPEALKLYEDGRYIGGFVQEPECGVRPALAC